MPIEDKFGEKTEICENNIDLNTVKCYNINVMCTVYCRIYGNSD